jgi:sugar lactone lactonase YvrE
MTSDADRHPARLDPAEPMAPVAVVPAGPVPEVVLDELAPRAGSGPQPVVRGADVLGECPVWWAERRQLLWVDIRGHALYGLAVASGQLRAWSMPGLTTGVAVTDKGRLLVALESDLALLDPDRAELTVLASPAGRRPGMRFNEMCCDDAGRIWIGYMNDRTRAPEGWLFRVGDGTFTPVADQVAVPNSLAWSPDNTVMYFADGVGQDIWRFDFDLGTGLISNRRRFSGLPSGRGVPDGAAVDADGYLWSANYGGGAINRYAPDGTVDQTVELPVSQPTACAFGGEDRDILFITTARQRLSPEQLAREPLAGQLFALRTQVRGRPVSAAAERFLFPHTFPVSEGS